METYGLSLVNHEPTRVNAYNDSLIDVISISNHELILTSVSLSELMIQLIIVYCIANYLSKQLNRNNFLELSGILDILILTILTPTLDPYPGMIYIR